MPLRVLIADDEPLIREGLAKSIDWESLDFSVCALAANGQEALDFAAQHQPDLMLVDIRMPFLSGLQLIEKVRQILPNVSFIIISGHDEFEYARQAINLSVKDYLLKPVNERQLKESVTQIRQEIYRKRKADEQLAFSKAMLQKNMTILRDQFLQQLITGQLVQEEIDELLDFHSISHEYNHFCLLRVINDTSLVNSVAEWDRQLLRFAMQKVLTDKLELCGRAVCTADMANNLFAFIQVDNYQIWYDLPSLLSTAMMQAFKVETHFNQFYYGTDWTSVSDRYTDWIVNNIRSSNRLTERALNYIDQHAGDPDLSFRGLCEVLFVSSSHLSKVFKQDTGQTFVDYLTKVRIQKALRLIQNPDRRIYEIASEVGYKTQHYFSAAFKKVLGVTPTEYRINNQGRMSGLERPLASEHPLVSERPLTGERPLSR